jgi:nucleoid DNA-binding protein
MIPYILKTLQKEDHVFIERLGEFRLRMKHAEIKKDTVYPPYNEVVFSPKESEENNFALANLVSREKQCLFTEANEMVTAWVDELLSALQHNKSVTYEGFGTFMLDKKGNLSFENEIIPQLNSLFEGMEPIELVHPIAAAVIEEEVAFNEEEEVKAVETETVEEPVAEPVGANNDSPVEPEPVVEPEPIKEPEPEVVSEPVAEPEPVKEPEPEVVAEPIVEEKPEVIPEPVVESEPIKEPEPVVEPEPIKEPEPEVVSKLVEEPEPIVEEEPEVIPEPVVEPEPIKEPEPEVVPEPVVDSDDDDEDEDDEEDEEEDDDDDEKKRHRLAWLWILLLILAVLGALGYIFKDKITDYYHQWKEKKQPVEQAVTTDEAVNETVAEPETFVEPETVENEPETVEEPAPETYTPEVMKQTADGKYNYVRFEPGHFYAIAGSFPGEADVERHIRQKKLDQYSPVIVKQDGVSNLRVCIGIFDTEEEAESFAKGVSSSYWVLK